MSFNTNTCGKCFTTTEFYGRYVPPCNCCGYPEIKTTSKEWAESLGVYSKQDKLKTN